ncbi:MAG TPA: hypothetical protein PLU46_00010 [Thiotrichales bacterium]|nr:hypothetical protein [Thiotrichales bacterium]
MAKPKTDTALRISANELQKLGTLVAGSKNIIEWTTNGRVTASMQVMAESDIVVFDYAVTRDGITHSVCDTIGLERTPCHFGGSRVWFKCPSCEKRALVLYAGSSGHFACRTCHNLTYSSQCESKFDRNIRRLTKIRKRLNWYGAHVPFRPHYMHRETFERLKQEGIARCEYSNIRLLKLFERLNRKLTGS